MKELSLDGLFLEGPRINFVPQKLDKTQPHPFCAIEYFVKKTLGVWIRNMHNNNFIATRNMHNYCRNF
jgi:hypothetical protein